MAIVRRKKTENGEISKSKRKPSTKITGAKFVDTPEAKRSKKTKRKPNHESMADIAESRVQKTIKGAAEKLRRIERIERSDDLVLKSGGAHCINILKRLCEGSSTPFKFAVFDIDGCLADDEWRLVHVIEHDDADQRFEAYHSHGHLDGPLTLGKAHYDRIIASGAIPVFITARPAKWRAHTAAWLVQTLGVDFDSGATLFMRPDGDHLNTVQAKQRALRRFIHEFGIVFQQMPNIIGAYDDREDIVEMYHKEFGIKAYVLDKNGLRDSIGLSHAAARTTKENAGATSIEVNFQSIGDISELTAKGAITADHLRELLAAKNVSVGYSVTHDGNMNIESILPADEKVVEPVRDRRSYDDVSDLLINMGKTFAERNKKYGNNGIKVGDVMKVLFPDGITVNSEADHRMHHLFNLVIVKLTRFVNSGLKHADSIHDLAIYAAMCEAEAGQHDIVAGV
ncbi:polynucleotide kinase [Luteibacter phage vB_LflM-Pluto]|uniref:Polynucleotide kinase n=1 Tax=Luteibacter phage vB_LflM-Pluto TaxID=2948611 RepID=A0A9E7MT49_9CAUD|nr:polynucleotide kinase [Luteibacter phage vB_LflM-Pluto]